MRERLLQFHNKKGWLIFGVASLVITVLIPVLNGLPKSFPLSVPDYLMPLMGKFLCFGMAAIAMDLIWGYTGILSLGHGMFFALGGYAMGMYLMRSIAGEGVYRSNLPDFMVFLDWKTLPWYWHGFEHFWFAMAMVVLVPGSIAFVFGWFAFRSRIKGVYLSIVTQALTYAAMLLFFQNSTGFGGNNGLTDFKRLLGRSLQDPSTKKTLYVVSAIALVATYLLSRFVVTSKLGRVLRAVRDAELKTRFCGYESTRYKTFIWTLSAVLCAIAGALYVPQVGIINPSEMQPSNSIELAIWAAVGGRGTLIGPLIGALFLNGAKSFLTAAFPSAWLYVLGGIFVLVTLFLPRGVLGLASMARRRRSPAPATGRGKRTGAGRGCFWRRYSGADMSAPPLTTSESKPANGNGLPTEVIADARDTEREVMPAALVAAAESPASPSVSITSSEPPPQPHASANPGPIGLWVEELTVSFDGFKALTDVTLLLNRGELRCIIGPNGAGKTTLMDCITGKTKPDKGQVFLESRLHDLTELSECEIAEMGVCRKFQRPTVFPQHTVYENCELALKVKGGRGVFRSLFARLDKAGRARIDEVLEIIGLSDLRHTQAGLLAHGHKQWLEIGMLLAMDPKVLLIDEPVAGMTQPEMERTAELVQRLAGERTVVVVEHDMEFVRSIARKVTVLHEGRILAEGPMADIQRDARVIEVYLGT